MDNENTGKPIGNAADFMGEAGPEMIIPISRDKDGKLKRASVPDGGPIYPQIERIKAGVVEQETVRHQGMSLRDDISIKAMVAILSDPNFDGSNELLAAASYSIADAMIKVRSEL